ncbi:hypothetical protein BDP81DRAFT_60255 [Colletotrichum phormii]|uniref:Uncharacterized protein n=1 Tax=Colletotrichum phormii TaxID=359342 RepID=A0AAJ0EF14_9PEZI|nr:uncharacterized protein BDP81DRAFT_60255 [Colletotrichum phormii]KAK1634510.1 hypothetical protein BDP81DRAFT_60255 [Colletotrichum phormii]
MPRIISVHLIPNLHRALHRSLTCACKPTSPVASLSNQKPLLLIIAQFDLHHVGFFPM